MLLPPDRVDTAPLVLDRTFGRIALGTGLVTAAIGAVAMAGWIFDVPLLRGEVGGWEPILPAAGVGLTCAGAALALERRGGWAAVVGRILGGLVLMLAATQLPAALDGRVSWVDAAIWRLFAPASGELREMPLSTALLFLFSGTGILSFLLPRRDWFSPSAWMGIVILTSAVVTLLSWLTAAAIPLGMAPGAVLAAFCLGLGLVAVHIGRGFLRVMHEQTSTGILGRRLLVVVTVLPALFYLSQLLWSPAGTTVVPQQFVMLTIFYTLALLVVFNVSLRKLDQFERSRAGAMAERERLLARLQEQAASLQQLVAERTEELQEALAQSRRFDHLARKTVNGVMITDPEDRIEWVNPAWEGFTGHRLEDVRGRRAEELLDHPASEVGARELLRRARAAGLPAKAELACTRKDGSTIWLGVEIQPQHNAAGQLVNYFTVHTDITARKEQEAEQRQLNERLQLALRAGNFGVWDWDVRTGEHVWNEHQLGIYGLSSDDVPGQHEDWLARVHPDDVARVRELERRALERGTTYSYECRIRRPDGTVRHLEAHGIVHRDEADRAVRVVGLSRDITAEREREIELGSLNQRLQFVVLAAGYGVWEYEFTTDRLTWDDRLLEIYGLRRADLTGGIDDWRNRVHPEDLPAVQAHLRDVLAGQAPQFEPEYRIVQPDGTVRHIESRSYLLRRPDGTPERMVGLNRDITAARELRERLRITEERWRLALSSNNDGVWDWDIPADRVYRDARYAEIIGVSPEDLPTDEKQWESLVHPDDLPVTLAALKTHLDGLTPFYQCEYRIGHAEGHWIWVLDRGKIVARDARGRPQRMVGTQTDITTRKTLEERLRHNEELALQLSRLAQIGAWEVELPSRRVLWGPEIYRIHEVELGYEPTVTTALSFYPPEARGVMAAAVDEAERNGTPFDLELPFVTARGHRLWVRSLGRAEMRNGRAVRLYGAFQDITARRDAEELRRQLEGQLFQAQKMETLGTLAGGIAHDFNNLLTGILGYQDLALDTVEADHPARSYLGSAREASMRARELVDQILTFSRQAGSEKVPVNLGHVVEEARRFLRATVPATIAIETEVEDDLPPVMADATQLHQVLLNLGSNAAHAMRTTGGTMRLAVSTTQIGGAASSAPMQGGGGRYVRLQFSDTGHGMEAETVKRVFDPFFTTKEVGQGTGLGLSVVHGIIQAHRGSIAVESTVGRGTTFVILLPAAVVSDADAIAPSEAPMQRGGGEMVAIVDDEDIVRSFAQMALEKAGYRVASFDQPAACLEAIRQDPGRFQLLLTDQTMPGMKGIELAAEVRAVAPEMPVVIMSGYFSRISPDTLARLGRIALLSKPFTNVELARALHRGLHPDEEPAAKA